MTFNRRLWHQNYKKKMIAQGRCPSCYKINDNPTSKVCKHCISKIVEAKRKRRKRYILEGKCIECGRPLDSESNIFCTRCLIVVDFRVRKLTGGAL